MRKGLKESIAVFLSALMVISLGYVAVAQKENTENNQAVYFEGSANDYDEYINSFSNFAYSQSEIQLGINDLDAQATTAVISSEAVFEKNNVLVFEDIGEKALFKFSVAEEAFYNIGLVYAALENTDMSVEISVKIDGKHLYEGLENTKLLRWFKNSKDEWGVDNNGNQFCPEQEEVYGFNSQLLFDDTGVEIDPYLVALTVGEHTIEIESLQEPFVIEKVLFTAPVKNDSYKQVSKGYDKYNKYNGKDVVIHGEDAKLKSSSSLTAKADNISADVYPNNPYNSVINYIGSTNWSEADQILVWEFNAPKDGLYNLSFHYKQSAVVNGKVFRNVKIDGVNPFSETECVAFDYDTSWQWLTLSSKGKPCKFYLEKGKHTITMSVTLGEISEYYKSLEKIVGQLGDQYLKIAMITGETPDQSRDYELFRQIPDLESVLKECKKQMNTLSKAMVSMSKESSTQYVSTINSMIRVINQMLERKYLAHTYKKDFYNQYCNLSSLLYEMKNMALSIDEIRFTSDKALDNLDDTSFWDSVEFWFLSFIASFSSDYNNVAGTESGEGLKLWVNWGRDQTQVLNALIQETFTAKHKITVNVQTTDATIIQGLLTNNAPDMALGVARSEPVNFAMRGATYDLTNFSDFEETTKRFNSTATVPYEYNGGVYALPDTQNFYIMFYRKDILSDIGVSVPDTWEEFIEATATIQRNNMDVYLPYIKLANVSQVNTGLGGLNLYSTLLSQNGVSVYNDKRNANILDSAEALDIFDWWTDMYTRYKVDVEQDFYNRFRVGVTPMGIAPYTTYTTFSQAAPEIEGRWGIALLPGVEREDGIINRNTSGSGTGCVILNTSKHKKEAWKFLKWWTSAETQLNYSRNVESLIGYVGRVATSNVEAFSGYSWKSADRDILLSQWDQVSEIPEVPGSYYLSRAVDQAFWETINGNNTASEALIKWSAVANEEIARKIKEYSN